MKHSTQGDDDHSHCLPITARCIAPVERYAKLRCRMLASRGICIDGMVRHLVCDALTDTVLNVRRWDRSMSITSHLCGVIRSRTHALLTRAQKFPTYDTANLLDPADVARTVIGKDTARKLVAALATLAHDNRDQLVGRLLDTYADGITKRADIIADLAISPSEYDNARERLARLLLKVPAELRDNAHRIALGQ